MNTEYSFWKGIRSLFKNVLQGAIPFMPLILTQLNTMPETSPYMDLTLGSALYMVYNYLKVKYKQAE